LNGAKNRAPIDLGSPFSAESASTPAGNSMSLGRPRLTAAIVAWLPAHAESDII
jgi:hypothetical protein